MSGYLNAPARPVVTVSSVAELRALSSTELLDGMLAAVASRPWRWAAGALSDDDGVSSIKPNDADKKAGRWLLDDPSDRAVVYVDATFGNDANGERGNVHRKFKSLAAAVAAAQWGDVVMASAGTYPVMDSLFVGDNVKVIGAGPGTVIELPNGVDFPAFHVQGRSFVEVRGFDIYMVEGPATAGPSSCGVQIDSGSSHVRVEGVSIRSVQRGLNVATAAGEMFNDHLQFVDCSVSSVLQFGVNLDDCRHVYLHRVVVSGSELDCFKVRKLCEDVHLVECVGEYAGGQVVANGIDCYAGGRNVTLKDCTFDHNTANGIVFKTDLLSRDDPAAYGIVNDAVISGCRCRYNTGYGITVHRHSGISAPDDPSIPLMSGVALSDCICESNGLGGFFVGGRAISLVNPIARRNAREGIVLMDCCLDVSISNPQCWGNGSNGMQGSNLYDLGIRVEGRRIKIIGGSVCGVDPIDARNEGDLGAATPQAGAATYVGIYVAQGADEVTICTDVHHCRAADIARGGGRLTVLGQEYVEFSGAAQPVQTTWTTSNGWVDNDDGSFTCAMVDGASDLSLPSALVSGRSYTVQYTVESISGGTLQAICGAEASALEATTGDKVVNLTCSGGTDFILRASSGTAAVVRAVKIMNGATVGAPASTGSVRLPNGAIAIGMRNSANTADVLIRQIGDSVAIGGSNNTQVIFGASSDVLFQSPKMGFFSHEAAAQPVLPTGSTVDQVIVALQSLGLVRQS